MSLMLVMECDSGSADLERRTRREELRDFLKAARARLTPEQVGLTSIGGRRRVTGLRREEVAELCGVSLAWYTLLETAREINVSPRLLHRLSCALRFTDEEKLHLFSLAIDELPRIAGLWVENKAPQAR
jgi:transcriptional regulator with XRE-family HTH domain